MFKVVTQSEIFILQFLFRLLGFIYLLPQSCHICRALLATSLYDGLRSEKVSLSTKGGGRSHLYFTFSLTVFFRSLTNCRTQKGALIQSPVIFRDFLLLLHSSLEQEPSRPPSFLAWDVTEGGQSGHNLPQNNVKVTFFSLATGLADEQVRNMRIPTRATLDEIILKL